MSSSKISRKRGPRTALIKGLSESLVMHEKVTTTKPKAALVKSYTERLITYGKKQNLASRRQVASKLYTPVAIAKVVDDLAKRFEKRPGGYVSQKFVGWRKSDQAELVTLTLTEAPQPITKAKSTGTPKKAGKK